MILKCFPAHTKGPYVVNKVFFFLYYRQKVESGQRRERRENDRGRERGGRGGRGRGRPEVIQSHSIFEQGPAEMMMKKRGRIRVIQL